MGPLVVIILSVLFTCDSVPMSADESKEKEKFKVAPEELKTVQDAEAKWLDNYRMWYYTYFNCECSGGVQRSNDSSTFNETLVSTSKIDALQTSQEFPSDGTKEETTATDA